MGKEIKKVTSFEENEVAIYRASVPQINDVIIICGDVQPSFSEGSSRWLRAIPVLINGQARALTIASFSAMACEGSNCYPQNAHKATQLINSCNCWSELKQLSGTAMKVVAHYPLTCYASKKKSTYKWTAMGCEWSDAPDHEFTPEEITALKAVIAEDQAKA